MPDPSQLLIRWLEVLVRRGGSDLFLVVGLPPAVRLIGKVVHLDEDPLNGPQIDEAILSVLPPQAAQKYRTEGHTDSSLRQDGLGRFRINLHHERGRPAAAIRALPARPPRLSELGLPANVFGLTRLPYGLVLVGGPTGSGKTTTLAALVDEINRRDAKHIITIEDPIEYEHSHQKSIVEQIEIGIDAHNFPTALRSALRQAPDVIVVGEMRDAETMSIALTAGETGHLVFSTLHTGDVTSTISRVADSFPPERQTTIRQELSMSLAAVMTQILLPRTGGGRIPAAELLMIGYGARQHIRKNALQHLHQEITITRPNGSFTFEESLATLVRQKVLSAEEARGRTVHPEELDHLLGEGT
ncbi:MAG TPA: PilT/PilU family type 4a pilus ATPase [Terriglobia bacterium]|nr:PilT/PilU family type 4a pilus ATPase [Terriglobia bacterium]